VDRQEITEELEHPGARNLLDSATLLGLAYNGSDGFPRVIPIGFYWNLSQIVVCTAATAPKVKALQRRRLNGSAHPPPDMGYGPWGLVLQGATDAAGSHLPGRSRAADHVARRPSRLIAESDAIDVRLRTGG